MDELEIVYVSIPKARYDQKITELVELLLALDDELFKKEVKTVKEVA